jgi:transposase
MRGHEPKQVAFTIFISIEEMVARRLSADHPLRIIKAFADKVLRQMSADIDALYAQGGRPSIAPELMLRAMLWQALFTVRSEIQLVARLEFDMLARWFVGLPLDLAAWDHSTFSANRKNLRLPLLMESFFQTQLDFLRETGLMSSEHLTVDGSLIQAWASQKSMVKRSDLDGDGKPPTAPKGGRNPFVDFKGTKRSNATHVSATDPDARMASKGNGTKIAHEISILTENRNNFVVGVEIRSPQSSVSERDAAAKMVERQVREGHRPATVGGDKAYADGDDLVLKLDAMGVRAHFSARDDRPDAIARAFHDDPGFPISTRKRMRIEEVFGYVKTIAGMVQIKVRGHINVISAATMAMTAYNFTHFAAVAVDD